MTEQSQCGCRAVELGEGYGHPPEGPTIIYCPTHAAAFQNEARIKELEAKNTRLNYELGVADFPGKQALVDRIQHLEAERDRLKQELDHIRQHHPVDDCPRENKGELFPSA